MIRIKKSPTADTRTCDFRTVSKETLLASSQQHIADVGEALVFFCEKLADAAYDHDLDKVSDIDGFHKNFLTGFRERDWLDRHYQKNRHHMDQPGGLRDDVNLIDVLDFVADQVMAQAARGAERPVELSSEILQLALKNTATLLKAQVVVEVEED